ncbi:MAG: TIGR01440 family protein [Anaerovoracaceae bacterium]
MLEKIKNEAKAAAEQLCEGAKLEKGAIVVVGCSSSEVEGCKIGSNSNPQVAEAIFEGIMEVLQPKGIFLAAQCCEHLNRAIIVEREIAKDEDIVNVVPQPKAGGSFATAAYKGFKNPVAVEFIKADAGLDIGGTLIGMHLKRVAVPLRIETKHIGNAIVLAARTRRRFVGGQRAVYDENLM